MDGSCYGQGPLRTASQTDAGNGNQPRKSINTGITRAGSVWLMNTQIDFFFTDTRQLFRALSHRTNNIGLRADQKEKKTGATNTGKRFAGTRDGRPGGLNAQRERAKNLQRLKACARYHTDKTGKVLYQQD